MVNLGAARAAVRLQPVQPPFAPANSDFGFTVAQLGQRFVSGTFSVR
jgi:hypothetical protein